MAEKAAANQAVGVVMNKLGLTRDEFRAARVGTGWLKTKKGIEKYTQEDIGDKVFRITMKSNADGQKTVYLFSEAGELALETFAPA